MLRGRLAVSTDKCNLLGVSATHDTTIHCIHHDHQNKNKLLAFYPQTQNHVAFHHGVAPVFAKINSAEDIAPSCRMLASKQGGDDHDFYWASTSQKCAACRHFVSTQMVKFVPRQIFRSLDHSERPMSYSSSPLQHMQTYIVITSSHLQALSAVPVPLTQRCSTLAVIVPGCTQQERFEVLPSPKARCTSSTGDAICTGFAAGLVRETCYNGHNVC